MNQAIENYEKASTPVFETHSMLLASAVCDTLENAGIAARLHSNGHYLVEVPADQFVTSQQLLFAEPRSGEIYFLRA